MWNSIYCGVSLILLTCTICDCYRGSFIIPGNRYQSSLYAKKNWGPPSANPALGGVDISSLPKPDETGGITYTVGLTQRAGINWGSDLSFRWVYVLELDQSGEASASGLIQKVTVPVLFQECNRGRDLKYCFYSSIAPLLQGDYIIAFGNDTTIGLDFDAVIDTLQQQSFNLQYTFFRGSKEQLMGRKMPEPKETTVTVTVVQSGQPEIKLQCPGGTNIRELLVDNGINVYRSVTRWTNCKGKQRCGTCIVDVIANTEGCTRKSLNENAALIDNPESYRLSCITNVYEDVTLEVMGPIGEAAMLSKA